MKWQPITTDTPRERDLLLYCPVRGVVRGKWKTDAYAKRPRPYWSHDREWIFGITETRADQPTHWMELPAAPEAP